MRMWGLILVALLALPATASAGSQPAVYYLRDGEMGPAGNGELNATVPNSTQPQLRVIPVGATDLMPIRFQMSDAEHPPRLLGLAYIGLWMGPSPIKHGNITATLVAVKGTEIRELANASFALDANTSRTPDPTTMIPPQPPIPPSDPEAYATFLAYWVLANALPAVQPPARLLFLGVLDEEIAPDEVLALDLKLTQGSSELPIPQGAFATLQYNGAMSPSFVYAPWYSPNPQVVSTYKPRPMTPRPSTESDSPSPSETEQANGTPAPSLIVLLIAVGGIAFLRRRRA